MPWPVRPLHIPGNADGKALITMLKTEAVSGAAGDGQPQDNSYWLDFATSGYLCHSLAYLTVICEQTEAPRFAGDVMRR